MVRVTYVPLSKTGLSLQWLFTQCSAVSHLSKTGLLHLVRVMYVPLSKTGLSLQWLFTQCSAVSHLSKTGLLHLVHVMYVPLSKTGLSLQWLFTQCSVSHLSKTTYLSLKLSSRSSGCSRNVLCHISLKLGSRSSGCSRNVLCHISLKLGSCIWSVLRTYLSLKLGSCSSGCSRNVLCHRSLKLDSCSSGCSRNVLCHRSLKLDFFPSSVLFLPSDVLQEKCVLLLCHSFLLLKYVLTLILFSVTVHWETDVSFPPFFTHGGLILINILSKTCLVWKKSLIAHFLLSSCELSPCNGTKSDLYVHVSRWLFSKKRL